MSLSIFAKAQDLRKKIFLTIGLLIVYRFGSYIPLPGVDPHAIQKLIEQSSSSIIGMFNLLSGGALGRMTIFALAIMPYITASIIMQLMTVVSKQLETLKKEGEFGRKKISQYTRYLTVILASFQAYGVSVGLEAMSYAGNSVVLVPGLIFKMSTVISLVGGTVFLMWVGEQITLRGIGNGISLIIFSGIVAGLPKALVSTFELGRTGALSTLTIITLLFLTIGIVYLIVFVEKAHRKILVQYPKRQVGNKLYNGDVSHLPLKLNNAGVIPPIFASSILLFPLTVATFSKASQSDWVNYLSMYLGHGKPLYIALYIFLIVFFCFFYTSVVFNPEETAENLKKYGGFIPGRRPGKNTAEFIDYILTRLTVIGAVYISLVCVLPEVLISKYAVPFYLGGTSILIVVNVVVDTVTQVQTHLFAHQYEALLKKVTIRGK